ncbi:MAG: undecaprenyldiphospho-muramoylpentapeptide beta-N-acetylglucosaminyltransferase [Gammaproteobacteria bacterium]|nr:MAG: undecaprenyldiphospho-muramoylpentapeptide beta-N-acetylglucosaminyltransferase [Gammaproteobacteria bacterium]
MNTNNSSKKIMIFAGGTGGHIYPAIAIASCLKKQNCSIQWVGATNKMEAKIVPQHGFKINFLNISGIRRKGIIAKLLAPFMLQIAVIQAVKLIIKHRPNIVLAMGGFVSAPGGIAAKLCFKKLYIHEQNAIAGMTNKGLSLLANVIFESYRNTFKNKKAIFTGNPLRDSIVKRFKDKKPILNQAKKLNLLLFGGSLGARILNQNLCNLVNKNHDITDKFNIKHQTGENLYQEVLQEYQDNSRIEILPFITDMDKQLDWADIVICRAGAGSVAECAAAGCVAIFIPLPTAVDDHQTYNAKYLSNKKAAILLPQPQLNSENLIDILNKLFDDRKNMLKIATQAHTMACFSSTDKIVEQMLK